MTPGTGSTLSYGFDASSNLTTLPTGGSGSYDNAGELSSSTLSGSTTNYTYDADGRRLTTKQGATTTSSATWNGAGQLATYSATAANMTAASYDGNGQRATATISSSSQSFVWNGVSQIPQLIMDSGNAYIYVGGLGPTEQIKLSDGSITYLVADSLGSVRGTVNSSGSLTGTTNYDAWGNPETPGGLTGTTAFGFAGGYTDPTGLIYLINRYYDPLTGQFISVDPLIAQTLAPYEYANGNPISNTDPSGDLYRTWGHCWDSGLHKHWGWATSECYLQLGEFATARFLQVLNDWADGSTICATVSGFFFATMVGATIFIVCALIMAVVYPIKEWANHAYINSHYNGIYINLYAHSWHFWSFGWRRSPFVLTGFWIGPL